MGLLAILAPALALAILFRKKIEETLAPAFILIMLLIYVPGLWLKLSSGYILTLILAGVSLIYVAFRLLTTGIRLKTIIFTPGAAALMIYVLFFAFYAYHRDFSHPDELYCWGLMAKNYFYYDSMFSPLSTALSADQTPLMPILDYFFARTGGRFDDSICYFAQNMFAMSLLLPVFNHVHTRFNAARFMIVTAMLPSILVLSGLEAFQYILADMIITAVLCFFVFQIICFVQSSDHYYYLAAILSLAAICLTKRMGPVFASVAIFIVTPICIRRSAAYIRELAGLMIAVAVMTFSWFGISIYSIAPFAALGGGLVLFCILGFLNGITDHRRDLIHALAMLFILGLIGGYMLIGLGKSPYAFDVMARFMQELFTVSTEDGYIRLSYGFYIVISLGMSLYLARVPGADKSGTGDYDMRAALRTLFAWTSIGMTVYALFMLYMHIWQIGPMNNNMESLIPRYIIPWEILVVFLIIYTCLMMRDDVPTIAFLAGFVLLICVSDSREFYRNLFAKHQCVGYNALSDAGIELESDDLVYFIDEQNYFTYTDREFYYRCWPAKTNFIDQIFMGNSGRVNFTADELEQMIVSEQYLGVPYDYLYLQTIDDDFAARYSGLFEDPAQISPGRAYYVNIVDGHLQLVPVDER